MAPPRTNISVIRTTIGQEKNVANIIATTVNTDKIKGVKAILVPESLRGYVFIECIQYRDAELAIAGVPHVRGRVSGKATYEEIDKFLVPKPSVEGLAEGDIVEIITGTFKGERAKVVRIDVSREEITLELLDSPHKIPIKVHADLVKLVEKSEHEDLFD